MPPKFRSRSSGAPPSESPEQLFDDLPRTRDRVPSLWAHQADMLRQYYNEQLETADVALELPTGAGKTIPALLIAEWRRSALGQRVAYVCPTHQLAHQVAAEAARQGLETVTLVGPHRGWDTVDAARYESARTLAVTTYSTVFNSNPHLTDPQTLVLDDAHAAEQYVASAWSVSVGRREEPDTYDRLLKAVSSELSGLLVQRLTSADPDPLTRRDVKLLPMSAVHRQAGRIDRVLSEATGDLRYRYTMIRDRVDRCLFYLAWDGILLRPYIPPTGQHGIFSSSVQRLYVSATLGEGGELERAFGRAPITRLPVPAGWDRRGSGRRFVIFPELIRGVEPRSLTRALVAEVGKALLIAPSTRRLEKSTSELVPGDVPVFSKGDIERTLQTFGEAPKGVLALANRYDGIDLADDRCRVTILDGAPSGEHLQERFLVTSLRAGRVLEERLRTRVVQGAGRSTRGLSDYSLVVVLGDDLTRFLSRTEVRRALRPEAQAEITFGMNNSEVTEEELRDFVRSFIAQDDAWQHKAEPEIADLRREAVTSSPPGTSALSKSAGEEVKAWDCLWRGDYAAASLAASHLCRHLTDEVLRPYRALWLYFAASWKQIAAEESGDPSLAASARDMLRKAHAAARGTSWLREVAPLPPADEELEPLDELAVEAVVDNPSRTLSATKWAALIAQLTSDLAGTAVEPYERGLTTLGGLLGAEAFKPKGKGRADSAWIFGDLWWLTIEAKSDARPTGVVSMDDVRQANTQLKSVSSDREATIPRGSVSLIVTPRQLTDPDAVAVANEHLYLCGPSDVRALADDAIEAWTQLRARGHNLERADLLAVARQQFREHRVLPANIRERLADQPMAG
jgi:DEAD/DEAH box helicase